MRGLARRVGTKRNMYMTATGQGTMAHLYSSRSTCPKVGPYHTQTAAVMCHQHAATATAAPEAAATHMKMYSRGGSSPPLRLTRHAAPAMLSAEYPATCCWCCWAHADVKDKQGLSEACEEHTGCSKADKLAACVTRAPTDPAAILPASSDHKTTKPLSNPV